MKQIITIVLLTSSIPILGLLIWRLPACYLFLESRGVTLIRPREGGGGQTSIFGFRFRFRERRRRGTRAAIHEMHPQRPVASRGEDGAAAAAAVENMV
ncbi:hypothetical protein M432DRAFT_612457 [Thermoascus aurantiacus ATCC 26904]